MRFARRYRTALAKLRKRFGLSPVRALDRIDHHSPWMRTIRIFVFSGAAFTARRADFFPQRYSSPCPASCPDGNKRTESDFLSAFLSSERLEFMLSEKSFF